MEETTIAGNTDHLMGWLQDREFYPRLFRIALPIALQNFIISTLSMVGTMMVGQLGATSIAAIGLANQILFLLNLVLFGITSGAAMFTAQLWGKRDLENIRKVLSLSIILGLASSSVFLIIAFFFPEIILGIFTTDDAVIISGSQFLKIFSWAYVFFALSYCYSMVLRSIGDVRTPLIVSISALVINTCLSYGLILGKFGFPQLGIQGAAIAGLVGRVFECITLLAITYWRNSPAATRIRDFHGLTVSFSKKVLSPILPVMFNELIWALGITMYSIIYARMGTDQLAAMNIVNTIDSLAFVLFLGIANGCAILVGHLIGDNHNQKAFQYSAVSLTLGASLSILIGFIIVFSSGWFLSFYKISPQVTLYAQSVLLIISLTIWIRVMNLILFLGVLRSGGDTRFGFMVDAGSIWLVGVPAAFIAAFVLKLPLYLVYLFLLLDELTKLTIGLFRFQSKKWIHNLARNV